ncbi:MAG: EI24 domain-containing protein [Acidobacteriota bacterium]
MNLLLGLILYTTLLAAGFHLLETWLVGWPDWLTWLLRGLLVIVLFVALGYILVRFGVVLGAPFYSRLSEMLEEHLRGMALASSPLTLTVTLTGVARDLGRAVSFEFKKLLLLLTVGLPILLLHLIPGPGSVLAAVGSVALGATIACLDFSDPPLERRGLSFQDKLGFIRRHFPASAFWLRLSWAGQPPSTQPLDGAGLYCRRDGLLLRSGYRNSCQAAMIPAGSGNRHVLGSANFQSTWVQR